MSPSDVEDIMVIVGFVVFMVCLVVTFILEYRYQKEAPYSLWLSEDYQISLKTKEYGIEFYVKSPSSDFDTKYPVGSCTRADIEDIIITKYMDIVMGYCRDELWECRRRRDFLTPYCDLYQILRMHEKEKDNENDVNHNLKNESDDMVIHNYG